MSCAWQVHSGGSDGLEQGAKQHTDRWRRQRRGGGPHGRAACPRRTLRPLPPLWSALGASACLARRRAVMGPTRRWSAGCGAPIGPTGSHRCSWASASCPAAPVLRARRPSDAHSLPARVPRGAMGCRFECARTEPVAGKTWTVLRGTPRPAAQKPWALSQPSFATWVVPSCASKFPRGTGAPSHCTCSGPWWPSASLACRQAWRESVATACDHGRSRAWVCCTDQQAWRRRSQSLGKLNFDAASVFLFSHAAAPGAEPVPQRAAGGSCQSRRWRRLDGSTRS